MAINNSLSKRIRLMANRVRCSKCNADSSKAVFVVGELIRIKFPIDIKEDYSVNFRNKFGKMNINKFCELISVSGLTRVCTICGRSRKTIIPYSVWQVSSNMGVFEH
jgi:hypothetical protein